jgi:hypothetical protein
MLSILLAIALFFAFFLVVAGFGDASICESREIRRQTLTTLAKPVSLLSITEAFDPINAILWQAPIAALELVESAGASGIPVAQLHPIFVRAATCFPEIYESCSFVQWLQFLEQNQLISWNDYRVVLTPEAREFLKYRFTTDASVEV